MSKIIVTTIGTSLYESASWNYDPDNPAPFLPKDYMKWVNNPVLINDPAKRKQEEYSSKLINTIQNNLSSIKKEEIPDLVVPYLADINTGMEKRFSAELGTIIKYIHSKNKNNWEEELSKYDIQLFYDPKNTDSYIAAYHLKAYLENWKSKPVDIENGKINGFSSTETKSLQNAILIYRNKIKDICNSQNYDEVILNTNGGYKLYSLYGFLYANKEHIKALYWHESAEDLYLLKGDNDQNPKPHDVESINDPDEDLGFE